MQKYKGHGCCKLKGDKGRGCCNLKCAKIQRWWTQNVTDYCYATFSTGSKGQRSVFVQEQRASWFFTKSFQVPCLCISHAPIIYGAMVACQCCVQNKKFNVQTLLGRRPGYHYEALEWNKYYYQFIDYEALFCTITSRLKCLCMHNIVHG